MLVDVGQLLAQTQRVVGHRDDVRVLSAVARVPGEPGRGHVRGAGRLDLLDALETLFAEQLVEVGYDLVQQPQALHALVVGLQLHVELGEVGYGREHYAHAVALLVVQFLRRRKTRTRKYSRHDNSVQMITSPDSLSHSPPPPVVVLLIINRDDV